MAAMLRLPSPLSRCLPLILLLALLSGCMYSADHQEEADALISKVHHTLQHQQWEQLASNYDTKFLENRSANDLVHQWKTLTKKYGKITKFILLSKQKDPRVLGEYYFYSYTILFERGVAGETITAFKGERNDRLTIIGQRIKPKHSA